MKLAKRIPIRYGRNSKIKIAPDPLVRICHVSQNWAGVPLRSFETVLNYITTTTTKKGLNVNAIKHEKIYETGQKFSKEQISSINIIRYDVLPKWSYKIHI